MRPIPQFLGVLACAALLLSALSGCNEQKKEDKKTAALPVTVLTAEPTTQPFWVEVFGQTEGNQAVVVYPQVTGPLTERLYAEGQPVRSGQTLFKIEAAPFQAAYDSAKAAVVQAQVNLERAEREAKRYAALHKARAVSEKEYTDAQSELLTAQANLTAAQAKEKEAAITLGYTTVKAPVDGIAGRALVNPGALVTANNTALTDITQDDQIKVRFSVSHYDLHGFTVTADSPVAIIADQLPAPVPAKIDFSATQIDPQTGSRSLSAQAQKTGGLLPGEYVTVHLTLGQQHNVYLVPQKAVRQLSDGTYAVYVLRDGQARSTTVKVGRWVGKDWIITAGLKPGDQVIIDQIQRLKDRMKVVKKESAAKPTT